MQDIHQAPGHTGGPAADTEQVGAVEEYPGQFDQIPVFPRPGAARDDEEVPDWLVGADPQWYRSDDGPILAIEAGSHVLTVRSQEPGWDIELDGRTHRAATFADLLDRLAEAGRVVGPDMSRDPWDGAPVATSLPEGFAGDLLWWCPSEVDPCINGVLFDAWYDAPAPDIYSADEGDIWQHLGSLDWEMRDGYSMTESEGSYRALRIGARLVTDDGEEATVSAWTSDEDARLYVQARCDEMEPEHFIYTLYLPGQEPVSSEDEWPPADSVEAAGPGDAG